MTNQQNTYMKMKEKGKKLEIRKRVGVLTQVGQRKWHKEPT